MATTTDGQIKEKFEQNRDGFALLGLSKGDLSHRIPKSEAAATVGMHPATQALRDLMQQLEMFRIQKNEVLAEGSKMLESTNTTDDFMATLSHTKTKDEVFTKYKELFV